MKMISQRRILGSEAFNITARTTGRYHTQPVGEVSGSGNRSVSQVHDQFWDLESVRLMEERYGIQEEGLF